MAAPIDLTVASSLEQQAFMIGLALQQAELAVPEEERPNNATIDYSTEENTVSITLTLNTQTSVNNGNAVITPVPYLV